MEGGTRGELLQIVCAMIMSAGDKRVCGMNVRLRATWPSF